MNAPPAHPRHQPPQPRPFQPVLPFEEPGRSERIPTASRAKCVPLLRALLEAVVLPKQPPAGGTDER